MIPAPVEGAVISPIFFQLFLKSPFIKVLGDVGEVEPIVAPAKPATSEYQISIVSSKKEALNNGCSPKLSAGNCLAFP